MTWPGPREAQTGCGPEWWATELKCWLKSKIKWEIRHEKHWFSQECGRSCLLARVVSSVMFLSEAVFSFWHVFGPIQMAPLLLRALPWLLHPSLLLTEQQLWLLLTGRSWHHFHPHTWLGLLALQTSPRFLWKKKKRLNKICSITMAIFWLSIEYRCMCSSLNG